MSPLITDLGIAIIVATISGYIGYRLKQPIILAYFLSGMIIGPEIGPQLISDYESIEIISEIGLILLLFVIGLEMNPEKIFSVLGRLVVPGVGQFLLTAIATFGIFSLFANFFSFARLEVLYLAIAVSLSSTAIVIKMLHDKYELDSIPGRITLGILIFQDLWAIMVIVLQPRFDNPSLIPAVVALLKAGALVSGGMLFSKYILRWIFESITRSPEMVVSVALGWSAIVAGIAHMIGLSMEMGALIAGISIASFPYSMQVTARIRPLRDFFLTLFFISLGMKISMPGRELIYIVPAVIFVVVVSRFLVLYPLLRFSGSSARNAFIASLNLSQMSEFSLVIVAIGISSNHVSKGFMSIMVYSMAITAILSSYLIRYNHEIFHIFFRHDRGSKHDRLHEKSVEDHRERDVFILGFHRGARALVEHLQQNYETSLDRIIVIDYNQEVLRELRQKKIHCVYGDISHLDALEHAGISRAKFILSTIPDLLLRGISNLDLVKNCRRLNPEAYIIATADVKNMIHPLKVAGANYVVLPYALLATTIADLFVGSDEKMIDDSADTV